MPTDGMPAYSGARMCCAGVLMPWVDGVTRARFRFRWPGSVFNVIFDWGSRPAARTPLGGFAAERPEFWSSRSWCMDHRGRPRYHLRRPAAWPSRKASRRAPPRAAGQRHGPLLMGAALVALVLAPDLCRTVLRWPAGLPGLLLPGVASAPASAWDCNGLLPTAAGCGSQAVSKTDPANGSASFLTATCRFFAAR